MNSEFKYFYNDVSSSNDKKYKTDRPFSDVVFHIALCVHVFALHTSSRIS